MKITKVITLDNAVEYVKAWRAQKEILIEETTAFILSVEYISLIGKDVLCDIVFEQVIKAPYPDELRRP